MEEVNWRRTGGGRGGDASSDAGAAEIGSGAVVGADGKQLTEDDVAAQELIAGVCVTASVCPSV